MKPLILEMRAFGSYADHTTVEFEKFKSGLFLVTGDTGGGKTTIFDAIVFALYGKSSGDERTLEMMHSDYVGKDTETSVKLKFEQNGRTYTVSRTLYFPKKRGKTEEYGSAKIKAVLVEEGGTTWNVPSQVTARITDILGLDADQFRQIVMLAQGEFQKFLKSDSDEKNRILGRLFDNTVYLRYEELMKNAADTLRNERRDSLEKMETIMEQVFVLPDGADAEAFLAGSPVLLSSLKDLMEAEEGTVQKAGKKKNEKKQELDRLHTSWGSAVTLNKALKSLEEKRAYRIVLDSRKPEMEALERKRAEAETVFQKIQPADQAYEEAKKDLKLLEESIDSLQERIRKQEEIRNKTKEKTAGDEEKQKTVEDITRRAQSLSDSLGQYRTLRELEEALLDRKKQLTEDQNTLKKVIADLETLQERMEKDQSESERLKTAEAVRIQKEAEAAKLREILQEIEGEEGLEKRAARIRILEKNYEAQEGKLKKSSEQTLAAKENYDRCYRLYFEGQSGLLAEEIRTRLKETGEAVCPVCRTRFTSGAEDHFARLSEEVPTDAEVEEAKKAFEEQEALRQTAYAEKTRLHTAVETAATEAAAAADRRFKDCPDWETLRNPSYLKEKSVTFHEQLKKTEEASEKASREARRYQDLVKELQNLQDLWTRDTGRQQALTAGIEKEKQELKAREVEIEENRKRLPFATEKEARQKIQSLQKEKDALSLAIEENRRAYEEAEKALSALKGALDTEVNKLPAGKTKASEAERKLSMILKDSGYDSVSQALSKLEGIANPEHWLKEKAAELRAYEVECRGIDQSIQDLEAQTKGQKQVDLQILQGQIDEAEKESAEAEQTLNSCQNLLRNHQSVYETIRHEKEILAGSDQAYAVLNRLSELAVGSNSEGGKLSFDRYVMGATFREIIEKANIRLEIMSGGQYQLVHQSESHARNRIAGLDIEVLDRNTGVQRESSSLSGGESFIVSLALALGLSDTVQSHSGGQALDTMFVDEGFGTLDDNVLDKAVQVLNSLSDGGHHLVGIISHVSRLEESIPQKISVSKGERGSVLRVMGTEG